jgi:heat shock protein HtpX
MIVDALFYNLMFGGERSSDNGRGNPLIPIIILLRYVLPMTTVLLMLYLSRTREYMADSGAVELMRENESLASALIKISQDHEANQDSYASEYGQTKHEEFRSAAYIFDPKAFDPAKSIMNVFSTHPSLEDRLKAMGCKLHTK